VTVTGSRSLVAACGASLAVLLVGCGGGANEAVTAEGAIRGFYTAVMEGDGTRACSFLSDDLREEVAPANTGISCETAFGTIAGRMTADRREETQRAIDTASMDVQVDGDTAFVTVRAITELQPRKGAFRLIRDSEGWHIISVGPA
jgi:hypothetical protein